MRTNVLSIIAAGIFVLASMLACNLGAGAPADNKGNTSSTVTEAPLPAPTDAAPAAPNACDNPYMPIISGATWNYNLSGPVPDTYVHSILSVEADGFTEQDVFTTGVTRQGNWKCENGNLIALEPAGGGSASVETEGMSIDFQTTALEGVTLPASMNPGDNWSQSLTLEGTQTINGQSYPASNQVTSTCTAIGIEPISVPAGTFDALRVDCETTMNLSMDMGGTPLQNTLNLNASNWYAMKVGLVKSVTTGGGMDSVIELTAFNIP